MKKQTVEYHSRTWDTLVEQGWITMTVDTNTNQATMIKPETRAEGAK